MAAGSHQSKDQRSQLPALQSLRRACRTLHASAQGSGLGREPRAPAPSTLKLGFSSPPPGAASPAVTQPADCPERPRPRREPRPPFLLPAQLSGGRHGTWLRWNRTAAPARADRVGSGSAADRCGLEARGPPGPLLASPRPVRPRGSGPSLRPRPPARPPVRPLSPSPSAQCMGLFLLSVI